jgi:hypothetical protein
MTHRKIGLCPTSSKFLNSLEKSYPPLGTIQARYSQSCCVKVRRGVAARECAPPKRSSRAGIVCAVIVADVAWVSEGLFR